MLSQVIMYSFMCRQIVSQWDVDHTYKRVIIDSQICSKLPSRN